MVEKTLSEQAAAFAAKAHKVRDPIVVDGRPLATGRKGEEIRQFVVVSSRDPNGPKYEVVLDSAGKPTEKPAAVSKPAPSAEGASASEAPSRSRATAPITISPDVNVLTLKPGEAFDETLVVTVPANPTPAKADIYFLADTTGSMGGILGAVQSGANAMLTSLAGLGADLVFGVGNYKDFLSGDPFAFQNQLAPTAATASVVSAISGWSASGGGDFPEAAFFALDRLAEPPGGTIGWRPGSKRIVVWFGDAPSHDPICAAASGLSSDITEASVTAKLQAENIVLLAISTATPGLDENPVPSSFDYGATCGPPGGTAGQATRLAGATGGSITTGINPTTIVSTIVGMVTAAVSSIKNVKLVPSPSIAPFVTSLTPAAGYGPLASDVDHKLEFQVQLTGPPCKPEVQHFSGTIDVVADGAVVASKAVRLTVPPCGTVYAVKFVCGTQPDCGCECAPVRPGRYATAIAIHNPSSRPVEVRKRIIPVVYAGAAVGREPRSSGPRAEDRILLPPHGATLDDCCRIMELLLGAPAAEPAALTVGFLELTADSEINVTAIYTAGGGGGSDEGCSPSISVETVTGRHA